MDIFKDKGFYALVILELQITLFFPTFIYFRTKENSSYVVNASNNKVYLKITTGALYCYKYKFRKSKKNGKYNKSEKNQNYHTSAYLTT